MLRVRVGDFIHAVARLAYCGVAAGSAITEHRREIQKGRW